MSAVNVLQAPLEHLAAIGLSELVGQAELLVRVDRKYIVPLNQVPALLSQAPAGTRVLQIEGRRQFGYRSTYLDTPGLDSFFTSGRSHRRRWKVRGRTYLDTGGDWLEVKTAGARSRTIKQRISHPDPMDHGVSPEGVVLVDGILGEGTARTLRPVLITSYRRSTLLLPQAGTRVTLDADLGWTSVRTGTDLERNRLAIIETKTGSTPSAFDRLLWAHGHRPVRISKYGAGMAALHPDLPRLKWHRTLQQHLSCPHRSIAPAPAAAATPIAAITQPDCSCQPDEPGQFDQSSVCTGRAGRSLQGATS